ncbi:radiation sensitive protein rad9 [Collariella sp. IMI 366227]|nr:radiation sensitive protein rad9 [Collariella sp. IMI 366227]
MQSKSLRQAEKKTLDKANDSQDTLVIAHLLMKDYGVGLTWGTRSVINEESQASSISETQDAHLIPGARLADAALGCDVADEDSGEVDLNLPITLPQNNIPAIQPGRARKKKMDLTQASTQSNTGRSYDQYQRPLSPTRTSPDVGPQSSPKPVRSSSPCLGTVDEDDTSAVRFDLANTGTNKTASPAQDDSGFVDFGSLAHFRNPSPNQTAQYSPRHPETPAPPQNPFRNSRRKPDLVTTITGRLSWQLNLSQPRHFISFEGSWPSFFAGSRSYIQSRCSSSASTGNHVVPESSHDPPPRKRSAPEPMSTYEPMRKSQERRATSEVRSDFVSSGEDDDRYDSIARRRRARFKKEAALKQLTAISIARLPKMDEVEVPSTSQRRRASQADAHLTQCHGKNLPDKDSDDQDAVKESQHQPPPPAQEPLLEDDDSTQSDVEDSAGLELEPTPTVALELPKVSTNLGSQPILDSVIKDTSHGEAIPETSPTTRQPEPLPEVAPSVKPLGSEAKTTQNFQSSPPAFSTRSRKGKKVITKYARSSGSTSSLSNLASTPQLPSSNPAPTVTTAPASSPAESMIVASSSPAVAQTKRRDARGRLPNLKTSSTESLRQSARVARRGSNSTDEISRAVSATPTFEQSLRVSRLSVSRSASRAGRAAMKPPSTQREQKLFENMAFAISFQSRKPGETTDQYTSRMDFSSHLQKRLKQSGGRLLEHGFDELFEPHPLTTPSSPASTTPSPPLPTTDTDTEITLTPPAAPRLYRPHRRRYSRKVKYMQALALGLPCIAPRWVTACLDRGGLVDWTPYLLCAGQSAFLGDAIRSRSLVPYDAAKARLVEVIGVREKLLQGSRILAVVKRALEGRKMAYVFLARVLGAELTRVYDVEEARGR